MERILKVISDFEWLINGKNQSFKVGDILHFGYFSDTIYYDINYDCSICTKGVFTQEIRDDKGNVAVVPFMVEDKYRLFQVLMCKEETIILKND